MYFIGKNLSIIRLLLVGMDYAKYSVGISATALEDSSQEMLEEFPTLEISAITAEYHEGLNHLKKDNTTKSLFGGKQ